MIKLYIPPPTTYFKNLNVSSAALTSGTTYAHTVTALRREGKLDWGDPRRQMSERQSTQRLVGRSSLSCQSLIELIRPVDGRIQDESSAGEQIATLLSMLRSATACDLIEGGVDEFVAIAAESIALLSMDVSSPPGPDFRTMLFGFAASLTDHIVLAQRYSEFDGLISRSAISMRVPYSRVGFDVWRLGLLEIDDFRGKLASLGDIPGTSASALECIKNVPGMIQMMLPFIADVGEGAGAVGRILADQDQLRGLAMKLRSDSENKSLIGMHLLRSALCLERMAINLACRNVSAEMAIKAIALSASCAEKIVVSGEITRSPEDRPSRIRSRVI